MRKCVGQINQNPKNIFVQKRSHIFTRVSLKNQKKYFRNKNMFNIVFWSMQPCACSINSAQCAPTGWSSGTEIKYDFTTRSTVLELKDMAKFYWCSNIFNSGFQHFRKLNFEFQIQVCLNQLQIMSSIWISNSSVS